MANTFLKKYNHAVRSLKNSHDAHKEDQINQSSKSHDLVTPNSLACDRSVI